jgi:hypothetical protein
MSNKKVWKGIIKVENEDLEMKAKIYDIRKNENSKDWRGVGSTHEKWENMRVYETNVGKISLDLIPTEKLKKNDIYLYEIKGNGKFKGFE